MPDWRSGMKQTYEYYIVDPETWLDVKPIRKVKKSTITRDSTVETLGSASFDVTESVGECYIRTYLAIVQNGLSERICLGTHLVQTPSSSFNGKIRNVTMDAYTPLLELKETPPPLGYSIFKDENIMDYAKMITREHARAPVVGTVCDTKLYSDFVANVDDTWLSYVSDLIANAKYKFDLDEMGRILFAPEQETASLQPVYTYDDDNSSILTPDISIEHDIYGIPNVVEIVFSQSGFNYYSRVVNDDPNSPTSTVNRGREIVKRVTNLNLSGTPTNAEVDIYAKRILQEASAIEYTVTYTHGYCGTRVGDCVRLNYKRADLTDIKAKIISQTITCEPGCPVLEKAVFTQKLWR